MLHDISLIVFFLASLGIGAAAARADYMGLKIPNILPLSLLVLFVPAYAADWALAGDGAMAMGGVLSHISALGIVLALTFMLFVSHTFGAGDSKLLTAYALWAGMEGLSMLVFATVVAGGFLGIAALVIRRRKLFPGARAQSWIGQLHQGRNAVPYGIAILAGAAVSYAAAGYFSWPLTPG